MKRLNAKENELLLLNIYMKNLRVSKQDFSTQMPVVTLARQEWILLFLSLSLSTVLVIVHIQNQAGCC